MRSTEITGRAWANRLTRIALGDSGKLQFAYSQLSQPSQPLDEEVREYGRELREGVGRQLQLGI